MDPILFGVFIVLLALWVYAMPIVPWMQWVIAMALVALLAEMLKRLIGNDQPWKQRPMGACRCDLNETTADVAHRPGFPSGHAAASTFLVVSLWLLTRAPSVLLFGVPWALWVAASRLQKHCHTVPQVVAGGLLGAIAGFLYQSFKNDYPITLRGLRIQRH